MTKNKEHPKKHSTHVLLIFLGGLFILALAYLGFEIRYGDIILPGVKLDKLELGGSSKKEAAARFEMAIKPIMDHGIILLIDNKPQLISKEDIDLSYDTRSTVSAAWSAGRNSLTDIIRVIRSRNTQITAIFNFNESMLEERLYDIAELTNVSKRDTGLQIIGNEVMLTIDTAPGYALDQKEVRNQIYNALQKLNSEPIVAVRKIELPQVTFVEAERAKKEAEHILHEPIILTTGLKDLKIDRTIISSWITSRAENERLLIDLDKNKIAAFMTTLASKINTYPTEPRLKIIDGKVVDFRLPKAGIILEEEKGIEAIIAQLNTRRTGGLLPEKIQLSTKQTQTPDLTEDFATLGLKELIGKATTSFVGSPTNRIANIKNGVKFLNGILIKPGQEFSTLQALGNIDNTTGYLPELVIRGDRTIPEFGGGLCQVSTTLFRAVLNTGLPIINRTNHSYRVAYYEKDGEGKYIGPGLDATIYFPQPDFKFLNDTPGTILIIGYVKGDKLTFELYGTKDGRESKIEGPKTLSSAPAGDPIYVETDELPEGVVRQVEKPHPSGTATAKYTVFRNGEIIFQKIFLSAYRPWPARFLVGTKKQLENTSLNPDTNNSQDSAQTVSARQD